MTHGNSLGILIAFIMTAVSIPISLTAVSIPISLLSQTYHASDSPDPQNSKTKFEFSIFSSSPKFQVSSPSPCRLSY